MRIVILYSPKDENYKIELEKHLIPLGIHIWDSNKILAGDEIKIEQQNQLTQTDLILALLSSDFISNKALLNQIREIHFSQQGRIVPIIMRKCFWKETEIRNLKCLPEDGEAIIRNDANDSSRIFDVADKIRSLIFGNTHFGELLPPLPKSIKPPKNPYPGITWFQRKDAPIFFGRNKEIKELIDNYINVEDSQIILLYGSSGVGKSSFLNAGILPRLENEYDFLYFRRNTKGGVNEIFKQIDFNSFEKTKIVIIDQLEEIYTNPITEFPDESIHFVNQLAEKTNNYEKIIFILSFRKEYLADIRKLLEDEEIYFLSFFLTPLNRQSILEAINGVTQIERLKRRYQLSIEESVVFSITNDVLKDKESNIAPLLQVILRKMWDAVRSKDKRHIDEKVFEENSYNSLELLLSSQIEEVSHDFKREVQSGLILDILNFFLTSKGTSKHRTNQELINEYPNTSNILQIKESLTNAFLLSNTKKKKTTRLSHDALGPIIKNKINTSQAPTQQINRYLEFAIMTNSYLSKEGLLAIMTGAQYRRKLSPIEIEIFENAKKRHFKFRVINNIRNNKISNATDLLLEYFLKQKNLEELFSLIAIQAKFKYSEKLRLMGLISDSNGTVLKNQFKLSLLNIVEEIASPLEHDKVMEVKELIGNNEIKKAIDLTKDYFEETENTRYLETINLFSSQILDYEYEYSNGLIKYDLYDEGLYRIAKGLLEILNANKSNTQDIKKVHFNLTIPDWLNKAIHFIREGKIKTVLTFFYLLFVKSMEEKLQNEFKVKIAKYELLEFDFFKEKISGDEFLIEFIKTSMFFFDFVKLHTIEKINLIYTENIKEIKIHNLDNNILNYKNQLLKILIGKRGFSILDTFDSFSTFLSMHKTKMSNDYLYLFIKYKDTLLNYQIYDHSDRKEEIYNYTLNKTIMALIQCPNNLNRIPYLNSGNVDEKYDTFRKKIIESTKSYKRQFLISLKELIEKAPFQDIEFIRLSNLMFQIIEKEKNDYNYFDENRILDISNFLDDFLKLIYSKKEDKIKNDSVVLNDSSLAIYASHFMNKKEKFIDSKIKSEISKIKITDDQENLYKPYTELINLIYNKIDIEEIQNIMFFASKAYRIYFNYYKIGIIRQEDFQKEVIKLKSIFKNISNKYLSS